MVDKEHEMTKTSRWLTFILVGLALVMTACGGSETPAAATEPAPTPAVIPTTPAEPARGQAYIESLEVLTLESIPLQVQAVVGGFLSDPCTSIAETAVEQQDATFTITIHTAYNHEMVCAQMLVPFSETVALNVQGLAAGTYVVTAGALSQTFSLPGGSVSPGEPNAGSPSLSVSVTSAVPGVPVTLTGRGFPVGATIDLGIGPVDSEYVLVAAVQSAADGSFAADLVVPADATPGHQWVFVAVANGAVLVSDPIAIVPSDGGAAPAAAPPAGDVNVPVNGLFVRTTIFLIAVDDGGQSGPLIGCNDSAIPVAIDIAPTIAPLTAAINYLLGLDEQFYGQSGLYNALYQSDLTLQGINIVDGEAIISLAGNLLLGGTCDEPRVVAQLEQTALQFSTVNRVTILLNGQPLAAQLGGQ
jgi:hypothetical protein